MNIQNPICITCGVQYGSATQDHCPVCEDSRQHVNVNGQQWTTLSSINKSHKNIIEKVAPNIYSIYTIPRFGIGQHAHLIISPAGNILWDCISNLDETTTELINKLGGIKAIAISHPHYYSTMLEWSKAFDHAPIYIHHSDEQWVPFKDSAVNFWEGREKVLWDDIRLVLCGGHFDGATVIHIPQHNGQLLTGDMPLVGADLKTVTFMYSYPNYIPLSAKEIQYAKQSLDPLEYNAVYSAFGAYILEDGKKRVDFSINRYLDRIKS
jgi:glyoxylase-like metal-dependent hydrolase (beta-lactamase superfamily II)